MGKPTETLNDAIESAQRALCALHPNLFSLEAPVPFSIGFSNELKSRYPEMPFYVRKTLMEWLTARRAYLAVCVAGAVRHGFDGPDGVVTEKEAAYAVRRYADRETKEAERAARRSEAA